MERNEFIKSLGLGFALACTGSCLTACGGKEDEATPPTETGTKVSIDLSQLSTVGVGVTSGNVKFFRIATGDTPASFLAIQEKCPHQGGALNWVNNQIQCAWHRAQFNINGAVVAQPNGGGSVSALKVYPVAINGTTLTATVA